MKKTLDDRQIHLWWNSTYARHWGDAYEDNYKYPTNASFLKEIKRRDERGESGLESIFREVKGTEEKGDMETKEAYHESNASGMISTYLRDIIQRNPKNPRVNNYLRDKYGRKIIASLFTKDPREWNY